jgi:hypothetical protein
METKDLKGRRFWWWRNLKAGAVVELTEGSTALGFDCFAVQAFGVFDGASVEVVGSLTDEGEPELCTTGANVAVSLSRPCMVLIADSPRALGPRIVGGTENTDVTIVIMGMER